MNNRKIVWRVLTVSIVFFCCSFPVIADDWRAEFDEICSKVQEGSALSKEELLSLVHRSEALIERLTGMDLDTKEVFLFRLKKCRSFFEYMIELKEHETSGT